MWRVTQGKLPNEEQKKALDWCVEYIRRNLTEDGVVFSDSDELENRISSGVNLNTSSLAYGGLGNYAILLKRMGKEEEAESVFALQSKIKNGIENYFGGEVAGYQTYHYHKGCNEIRAWNCLPVYMGITERAKDTLKSIDEKLWTDGSCRSTEGEKILWVPRGRKRKGMGKAERILQHPSFGRTCSLCGRSISRGRYAASFGGKRTFLPGIYGRTFEYRL